MWRSRRSSRPTERSRCCSSSRPGRRGCRTCRRRCHCQAGLVGRAGRRRRTSRSRRSSRPTGRSRCCSSSRLGRRGCRICQRRCPCLVRRGGRPAAVPPVVGRRRRTWRSRRSSRPTGRSRCCSNSHPDRRGFRTCRRRCPCRASRVGRASRQEAVPPVVGRRRRSSRGRRSSRPRGRTPCRSSSRPDRWGCRRRPRSCRRRRACYRRRSYSRRSNFPSPRSGCRRCSRSHPVASLHRIGWRSCLVPSRSAPSRVPGRAPARKRPTPALPGGPASASNGRSSRPERDAVVKRCRTRELPWCASVLPPHRARTGPAISARSRADLRGFAAASCCGGRNTGWGRTAQKGVHKAADAREQKSWAAKRPDCTTEGKCPDAARRRGARWARRRSRRLGLEHPQLLVSSRQTPCGGLAGRSVPLCGSRQRIFVGLPGSPRASQPPSTSQLMKVGMQIGLAVPAA